MIPVFTLPHKGKYENSKKERLWGFIDETGIMVIEPKFSAACYFSSDLAYARGLGGEVGFINKQGDWAIEPQYFDSLGFWSGLASTARLNPRQNAIQWGVIRSDGTVAIDFVFDFVGPFMNGLARAQVEGKWGYINIHGEWVISPHYDWAGDFVDGIARVQQVTADLATSYIVLKQDVQSVTAHFVTKNFCGGEDFSEGLAAVKEGDLWGYIGTNGQWSLSPRFLEAGEYSEGRMPVLTNEGWKLCDSEGQFHSRPYEQLEPMACGLSRFSRDEKWGFIDRNGTEVVNHRFDEMSDFCEGHAIGIYNRQFIVINKKGETLWTEGAF